MSDGRLASSMNRSLYGTFVEFNQPEALIAAARRARALGYRKLDAFTPYPVEGLDEAIGFTKDRVALLALLGGIGGGAGAFLMQAYANVADYPIPVAGRPAFSWPAFIPVTFELTVLGAALLAAFGMLILNRLPRLWHPAFELPAFARASRDRFFLLIRSDDPAYDAAKIRTEVLQENPVAIHELGFDVEVGGSDEK